MFDDVLIESAGTDRKQGTWITALISGMVHLLVIGVIIAAGLYVKENPEIIEKPMDAFIVASAPPPPPPPPASGGPTRARTRIVTPQERQRDPFTQPRDTPRHVPVVQEGADDDSGAQAGGVVGGVKGGETGGVVGGESRG